MNICNCVFIPKSISVRFQNAIHIQDDTIDVYRECVSNKLCFGILSSEIARKECIQTVNTFEDAITEIDKYLKKENVL